jgi:hypothetical protein
LAAGQTGDFQSEMKFAFSLRESTPLNVKSTSLSLSERERAPATALIGRGGVLDEAIAGGAFFQKICFPFRYQPAYTPRFLADMDNLIEARELQIERKHFHVEFRENDRGKFLRITEEAHGRRNTIIVPSTGVDEFTSAIEAVIDHAERAPA